MRKFLPIAFLVLIFSCNQSDSKKEDVIKKDQQTDSTKKVTDSTIRKTTDHGLSWTAAADTILKAIKERDYEKLAMFIHPQLGVRFFPYSHIDTPVGKGFSAEALIKMAKEKNKIDWGSGFADPEKLTIEQYFAQYVYDKDYLKVGKKAYNSVNRGGTAEPTNLQEVYANHDIAEYFFPGTKKNGNMDWSAVRLVFENKDDTPFLVAVVYDHWTP